MSNIFEHFTMEHAYAVGYAVKYGKPAEWQDQIAATDLALIDTVIAELDVVVEPEELEGFVGNYAVFQFVEDVLSILAMEFSKITIERPLFAKQFEDTMTKLHTYRPTKVGVDETDTIVKTPESFSYSVPDTYINKLLPDFAYAQYIELKIMKTDNFTADSEQAQELRNVYGKMREYLSYERQQAIDTDKIVSDIVELTGPDADEIRYSYHGNKPIYSRH